MTIINCSSNCLYQWDGICHRDSAQTDTISNIEECIFFEDPFISEATTDNCELD